MKIFIASLLLFFTNCLAPTAVSATVNVKTAVAHSVISPVKKLSFKEKLLLKLSKKDGVKLKAFQVILLVGILLLILGVILFYVSDQKSKAAPQGGFVPSFEGVGEGLLGLASSGLGLIFIIASVIGSATKKKEVPKQVP
jgi:hypothetical protein